MKIRELQKMDLPTQRRQAAIVPGSINEEARTVDVTWSTGAKVLRSTWWGDQYFESLSMDPAACRMERLQSGSAPLLDTHDSSSVKNMLGVVPAANLDGGLGRATLKLSNRPDVQGVWQDIRDGIIQNVSVGYNVYKFRDATAPGEEISHFEAIDWEPCELSVVPVGADPDAGMRSAPKNTIPCEIVKRAASAEREIMPNTEIKPVVETTAAPAAQAPNLEQERKEGAKVERQRQSEIRSAVKKAGLPVEFADELIDGEKSVDQARAAIIDKLHETRDKPVVTKGAATIVVGDDEKRTLSMRSGVENAFLHRSEPSKTQLSDDGREFRGYTMMEIARRVLEMRGISTVGMSKMELAKRALESTSDLPSILANVANKSLRDAYLSAPRTFMLIGKENQAADFKQMSRTWLSDAPALQKLNEGGEIKRGAFKDGKEVYQLASYATIVPFSRQVIINDDLNAITRVPAAMARAAADLESDTAWTAITANPTMGDNVALFNSTHGNLAGSGAALDVTPTAAGRTAMRSQTTPQGKPMNLIPKMFLVDPSNEAAAEKVVGPIVANQASSFNPFSGKLVILVEPRLKAASGAQPWYLAGDVAQCDILEYSYLEGQQGAYLETRQGFEVDGLEMKVRLDFAAKVLDWRNLYKNPGV
jgi:hypothetical protein